MSGPAAPSGDTRDARGEAAAGNNQRPNVVVGVIGHVDHGKTALVRALTGQDTDRLPEEKARGISIALGFAFIARPDGTTIDLIDMPGHERFVRTMISGATGLDAALLVVAADEGVMPQTREHVAIAGLLGLTRALVAVTKADLVLGEVALAAGEAARDLLAEAGLASPAPLLTSARNGAGIADLTEALATLGGAGRRGDGCAYLPIDRAFAVHGHGPVATGTLRGATLAVGDRLELLPAGVETRVRALQVHGANVETASPGSRVAVNLRGVEIGDLARGMALTMPGALVPSEWLTVSLSACPDTPLLTNGMRLVALAGTMEMAVRLRLLDAEQLAPGDSALAQLRLTEPLALPAREAVILRLPSPARTVAGGRILEPVIKRRRRHDAAACAWLGQLRDLSPEGIVAAEIARARARGTTLARLGQLSGLAPASIAALLETLGAVQAPGGMVLPAAEVERRRRLTPRADPGRERARQEHAMAMAETLRIAGLTPPTPLELLTDAQARASVDRLLREGVAIRAVDRAKDKELIFHRDAITEARARLAPLLRAAQREGGLLVSEICEALGITRKFAMPLLDHLDGERFTRRVGDRRVLAE